MNAPPAPTELEEEFERRVDLLKRASASMQESIEAHDGSALGLAREATTKVAPYHEPEMRRARPISESAEALEVEISRSRNDLNGFEIQYRWTVLAVQDTVMTLQIEIMTAAMNGMRRVDGDGREVAHKALENTAAARAEMELTMAHTSALAGSLAVAAMAVATVFRTWDKQLRTYLAEAPSTEGLSLFEGLWEEIQEESAFGIAELVFVEVVGVAAPAGMLISTIAKIALGLRRKAVELSEVYARNDIDALFDLVEALKAQQAAMADARELIDRTKELADLRGKLAPDPAGACRTR